MAEKAAGKTILMSSHMFEEVEKVCDSVLIIKEGRIVAQSDVQSLKGAERKVFLLTTATPGDDASLLKAAGYTAYLDSNGHIEIHVAGEALDRFIKTAAQLQVRNLSVKHQTLEDVFISYYGEEGKKP